MACACAGYPAGRSVRKAFPVWADYRPNSIWIYDTTHFTAAGMAAVAVMDLVSRKWLTEIVSVEETSTQVAQVFTAALHLEGMDEAVADYQDTLVDPTVDDPAHPILLAVSDNGPQMTSVSTRAFMALNAIGQHFAPPRHPHRSGLDRDPVRTSRPNGHTRSRFATQPYCAPSSPSYGSITTRFACTKGSAM